MNIFFIDLFISIDTLSPITYLLNEKKISTKICNINPIQDHKKNKIIHYLTKNNKAIYENFDSLSFLNYIKCIIIKIILFLPKGIICRNERFWLNIYQNSSLYSEQDFEKYLIKSKAKTVTIEESLLRKNRIKIYNVCKKLNIKLIKVPSGLTFAIQKKINNKFIKNQYLSENLSELDYFLSPNTIRGYRKKIKKSKKFYVIGSARYNSKWLNILDKIYKKKFNKNKKYLNLGFFLKKTSEFGEYENTLKLVEKLKKNENLNIKIRNKPRDALPFKCSSYYDDELNSVQLINWADIVIVSRQTSILIEAVKKKKVIFFLNYINKNFNLVHLNNYKYFFKIKSEKNLIKLIKDRQQKKIKINLESRKKILQDYCNNKKYTDKQIVKKFNNFYLKVQNEKN